MMANNEIKRNTKAYKKDKTKKAIILQKPSACVAITGEISAVQRKFYNGLLLHAREDLKTDPSKEVFAIDLADLKGFLGINDNDRSNKYYAEVLKGLARIVVDYNILQKDRTITGSFVLVSQIQVDLDRSRGRNIVTYALPPIVREKMLQIREGLPEGVYATLDLTAIRELRSKHAITLYELCKDYEKVGVPVLSMEELRKLFGIYKKKGYEKFKDIKKRILDPAVRELNESDYIDFTVSYKVQKNGREYTGIEFHVMPKKNVRPVDSYLKQEEISRLDQLLSCVPPEKRSEGLKRVLVKFFDKDDEYIVSNLRYAVNNGSRNFLGYVVNALREDYAREEREAEVEHKKVQAKLECAFREKEKKIEEAKAENRRRVQVFINSLSKEEYNKLMEEAKEDYKRVLGTEPSDDSPFLQASISEVARKWMEERGLELVPEPSWVS